MKHFTYKLVPCKAQLDTRPDRNRRKTFESALYNLQVNT